jgi:hypothetical protein
MAGGLSLQGGRTAGALPRLDRDHGVHVSLSRLASYKATSCLESSIKDYIIFLYFLMRNIRLKIYFVPYIFFPACEVASHRCS